IILAIAFYFVKQMFAFKLPIPHMDLKGENIVGELLTGGNDKDNKAPKGDQEGLKSDQRIILLSAHYDSISTRFRVPVLKMLLIPAGLALLLFLLLYLITLVLELFHFGISPNLLVIFKYVYIILSIIVSAILVIMIFDKKENKSPGACDNATGVAIILKIAQIIKDRLTKGEFNKDKESIHFIFLFTAGEELGLFGSRAYLKEHNKSLSMVKDKFYQINVDMVGSEIAYLGKASLFSNKPPNRFLNKALERCAEKNKIETRSFKSMFGSSSDHAPFMNEKFESFLFCSTHDDQIHSKNDTPEKINPQKMKEAVKLIECMIDMIRQEDNLGK
ncbi:MAG: M28 family metallopeptidase, partial [Promethearchaeota archaeon]